MQKSELRLIKNALEYLPKDEVNIVPKGTRGIYVLYKQRGRASEDSHHYDFVYVGMASNGIKARLNRHIKNKGSLWTHFSFFEVWDNISDNEIEELEGLFRHLYKFDSKANSLNKQKGYKKLGRIRVKTQKDFKNKTGMFQEN